jgi:hypothetical protein
MRIEILVLPLLFAVACSPKPAQPKVKDTRSHSTARAAPETVEVKRADILALFAREQEVLPPTVTGSGQGWSAQFPAIKVKVEPGPQEGWETVTFDLAPGIPTTCFVLPGRIEPAKALGSIFEGTRSAFEVEQVLPTRVAVEQQFPVYFASIFYRQNQSDGYVRGQLKVGFGVHPKRSVMCMQDAPGYSATFEKVVRSALGSFEVQGLELPVATSISLTKIGDTPIGFDECFVERLENGNTKEVNLATRVVPLSPTEIGLSDLSVEITTEKFQIVEGHFVESDLQGNNVDLRLKRVAAGKYQVEGAVAKKPFTSTFTVKQGLASGDARSLRLKEHLARNAPFHFSQAEYDPFSDPNAAIDVSYSRQSDDPAHRVRVLFGKAELLTDIDENGETFHAELLGGKRPPLVHERLYHRDDRLNGQGTATKTTPVAGAGSKR